uniref:Metallophosphoesterase n=1 Tax=Dictyoglomus thermophilum TaxID=14 RepID=A0A7C3MRB6_DICTH
MFKKKSITVVLVIGSLLIVFLLLSLFNFLNPAMANMEKVKAKIAIFSDPHYFSPNLLIKRGPKFEEYIMRDRKMILESPAILKAVIEDLKSSDVDIVLIPGDLTKDGEEISHLEFAGYLKELKDNGKKVYVINGNHDINNNHAYKYDGDKVEAVKSVTPEEFKKIYWEFGYKEAIAVDNNSLSYVVEPIKDVRIIAIDACKYNPYSKTEGEISKETLDWILKQVEIAKKENKIVFGMMHHGILEHFEGQKMLFPEYIINNYEEVAKLFAEKGLNVIFTGHFHAQDIVRKDFQNGNFLLDIETGSLVTYPCPYRMITLTEDNKLIVGNKKVEKIDFDIKGISFQDYAYDFLKTGIKNIIPQYFAGYLMKKGLSRVEAMLKANNLLSIDLPSDIAPNSKIIDILPDAIISHYKGDEKISKLVLEFFDNLAHSEDDNEILIGKILISYFSDLPPDDNDTVIDLNLNVVK